MASKSHGKARSSYSDDDDDSSSSNSHKKYETAARAMPIGTVVWYWSAPTAEPQAAIVVGRTEDGEHCNLVTFSALGQVGGRQNVLQAKAGDEATGGEYFQEMGAAPLEVPEPKQEAATTDSSERVA